MLCTSATTVYINIYIYVYIFGPCSVDFPLELGEKKDRPIGPSNLKPKRGHSCSCCCQDGCTSGHVQVGSRPVLDFAAVSLLCRWVKPVQAVISVLASGLQQGDV